MKDRRYVDDLSVEELERILFIKRREARLARLRQLDPGEQVIGRDPLEPDPPPPVQPPLSTAHRQFQGVGASAGYSTVKVKEGDGRSWLGRWINWLSAPLHINWRFVLNGVLLLVEVAAVTGLILIAVGAWRDQEKINEEVVEVFVPPTPTPTPVVGAVVLPGGHTPPDARGFSQPEPIPEHLRALAQAITPQPLPTPGPGQAKRVVIPAIDVDHPVVEGDDWEALKRGVGHTPWSANPGEAGNCIFSAHNDIFGEIFRRLPEMELGDDVYVYTQSQVYHYVVKTTRIIEPTQVEVMYSTTKPVLTLISSYPYLVDDKRIVVMAELEP